MHASRPTFTHTRTRTRTERRPRQSDHVTASSPASAWTQQSKHIIVSHSRCSRPENQNGLGGFEDAPTRPRKAARRTCPRAFPYSYATARASRSSGGLVLLLRSLVRRPSVANSPPHLPLPFSFFCFLFLLLARIQLSGIPYPLRPHPYPNPRATKKCVFVLFLASVFGSSDSAARVTTRLQLLE